MGGSRHFALKRTANRFGTVVSCGCRRKAVSRRTVQVGNWPESINNYSEVEPDGEPDGRED